ncbi:hypothetical protein AVEN_37336-1 [Araneus ventricosus]|uniref:Uncharacterized protein n=1 Tax=Araneus ventricosus TaxID=182803 RepID=A0A4Y2PHQ9_ARAVE|nr:hypothetical protein AVEN_37336-1 [Araneus ventricosus]
MFLQASLQGLKKSNTNSYLNTWISCSCLHLDSRSTRDTRLFHRTTGPTSVRNPYTKREMHPLGDSLFSEVGSLPRWDITERIEELLGKRNVRQSLSSGLSCESLRTRICKSFGVRMPVCSSMRESWGVLGCNRLLCTRLFGFSAGHLQ